MKKIFVISLAAVALFASCAKQMEIVAPTGVNLDQTALTMTPGQVVDLKATITPSNVTSTALTWTSSNTAVATVTKDWGQVAAIAPDHKTMGPGKATITATTSDGKQAVKCEVTVNPIKVTGITLDATAEVYEFEELTLSPKVTPANASFKDSLIWVSSDKTIATVEKGVVKGLKKGKVKVTVTTKDGGYTAECNVTVAVIVPTEPEILNLWRSDEEGYRGLLGADADNGKTAGEGNWLSYDKGVASWTENTTGKIRTATLELSTGSKITLTQGEAKDIASKLAFYNYSFKAFYANTFGEIGKTVIGTGDRNHKTAVQLVAVEEPKDLNGHVHNMDIVGLYYDAKVPVSVEFSPEGCKFFTYLSLDYQKVNTGSANVDVAIIPELTNSTTYGSGYFAPLKFGVEDCNYAWVEWGFDVNTGKVTLGTAEKRKVADLYCCGFSIVTKGYAEGSYTTIYQFNYHNKWTPEEGAFFERF